MSKRLLCIAGGIILLLASATAALAQDNKTNTTTTTTVTQTVQNPDGSYTIIEYPVGKEVMVDLTPTAVIPGAQGHARVLRAANGTTITMDLTGITADVSNLNVYAVDPTGKVTLLGPVTINNGAATYKTTASLDRFMLVLSPEADLSSYGPDTNVILRSAVPQGFAVVPYAQSGPKDGAVIGERVAATTTSGATPAYDVPMLGIPDFRRGTDTHMKVKFSGDLSGSRANVFIKPRKDGPTEILMRFHDLKRVPSNARLVLWAVGPDNTYTRLGQVVTTGQRNEGVIKTESSLSDFGLFVTMENASEPPSPTGQIYATIIK